MSAQMLHSIADAGQCTLHLNYHGAFLDTVVIGAGLSGLTAAATLRGAGADVSVVEADAHIGGRIRSLRDIAGEHAVGDLGPTWVWPKYQPVAARWLERLGMATFEQFSEGDAVITGYGPTPLRQPVLSQDGMVRIQGGPSALIETLANQIGGSCLRTSARAVSVLQDGHKSVAINLSSGEVITAQRVIISIPLRVAATTLLLPWAPPALKDAMLGMPTWMSTHAKAVVLYERPFWRDAGLSGRIASRVGPLIEAHDHSGVDGSPAALFGFVGWSPEQRRNDPEGLRTAILNQLAECFGPHAANPLELAVQDWATNPNIVTASDLTHPAAHPDIGPSILRASHLNGRVRFAVSEASELSPGLIEGALAIGETAALKCLSETHLRD